MRIQGLKKEHQVFYGPHNLDTTFFRSIHGSQLRQIELSYTRAPVSHVNSNIAVFQKEYVASNPFILPHCHSQLYDSLSFDQYCQLHLCLLQIITVTLLLICRLVSDELRLIILYDHTFHLLLRYQLKLNFTTFTYMLNLVDP